VEWLRKYGRCVDNIVIQTATDPEMGRGAFAKRTLPKDTIVVAAPIQFFKHRQAFAKQIPEALFVNYCYQPPGTDMLLYPYGPGVNLINHGSGHQTNVQIRWSTHYMSHTPWLNLPDEQFWQMQYPGSIMFDYVAIRDIRPGEELFIDYGIEWEQAWKKHVEQWKPYNDTYPYTYVEEMDTNQPYRTTKEQKRQPYASNLKSVCFTPNWNRDEYTTMNWTKPDYVYPTDLTYCNILERDYNQSSNEYIYNVSLLFNRLEPDEKDEKKYIDLNIPHWAISFVDKPYMSDMHLPNAFRHPMVLPSDMIPSQWLNKATKHKNIRSISKHQ
jgi:SET domain